MNENKQKALVVLSGGQDSTTCLFWAIQKWGSDCVYTLTFDYGQRHRVELESAQKIAEIAHVPNEIISIDTFKNLGENALTGNTPVVEGEVSEGTIPNTFVPGRNLIFMTFAAAWAYKKEISELVTGVAQTDYSGYPDCRKSTLDSLQETINLGMEANFTIHTPLMNLSKKETVLLAQKLGAMDAMAYSHTCYNGEIPPCGKCPACILREKGFAEAKIVDPLIQRVLKF